MQLDLANCNRPHSDLCENMRLLSCSSIDGGHSEHYSADGYSRSHWTQEVDDLQGHTYSYGTYTQILIARMAVLRSVQRLEPSSGRCAACRRRTHEAWPETCAGPRRAPGESYSWSQRVLDPLDDRAGPGQPRLDPGFMRERTQRSERGMLAYGLKPSFTALPNSRTAHRFV